jgi:peptidylprolyl isomerase
MSTPIHDIMVLETTQGPVKIEMRPDLAPQHVARIKELVQSGFYDGIVFHRVIEGFMAQTGCPHGTGTGGSGVKLKAEFNTAPHVRGTASMARAQNPDSGDSQFFICFDDARFLDRQYTVWGQVISGMDNVDKIKRGEPVRDPDKIVKAYIETAAPAAEPVADHAASDEAPVEEKKKPAVKKAPAKAKTASKKSSTSKKKS